MLCCWRNSVGLTEDELRRGLSSFRGHTDASGVSSQMPSTLSYWMIMPTTLTRYEHHWHPYIACILISRSTIEIFPAAPLLSYQRFLADFGSALSYPGMSFSSVYPAREEEPIPGILRCSSLSYISHRSTSVLPRPTSSRSSGKHPAGVVVMMGAGDIEFEVSSGQIPTYRSSPHTRP